MTSPATNSFFSDYVKFVETKFVKDATDYFNAKDTTTKILGFAVLALSLSTWGIRNTGIFLAIGFVATSYVEYNKSQRGGTFDPTPIKEVALKAMDDLKALFRR